MSVHLITLGTPSLTSQFSSRSRFSDWPNTEIPLVAAGVYAIWHGESLVYFGMSGRGIEKIKREGGKKEYGLITRLRSHWSGRLSGDQFCVYVANRLVIPSLRTEHLPEFAKGKLSLDALTRIYIHQHFEYQYLITETSADAFRIEAEGRRGELFSQRPFLNPSGSEG